MTASKRQYPLGVAILVMFLTAHLHADNALKVLILTGQNNHNWKETTPRLQKILTDSRRFIVDVTEHPEQCSPDTFAKYNVILSNWNSFGNAPIKDWPTPTKEALLKFVRDGGGLVVVHAGGCMFPDWTDFHKMIGATWGKGTGHGARHMFEVKITEPNHPITQGMKSFTTMDELWHGMVAQPEKKVLATAFSAKERGGSGQDEPVVMVTEFGKGRCFNLVLGHDTTAMKTPGFRALLLRGTEWAATGKVTLPPVPPLPTAEQMDTALKAISGYRFGQSREPLVNLEDMVFSVTNQEESKKLLASKLAAMLSSDATTEAKQFLCKQLSLIGGAAEVPALARLLTDKDLAFYARYALERIPGEEALIALRSALPSASGSTRVGLINSLAVRGDEKAIPLIANIITGADEVTCEAAINALGKIGGVEALHALRSAVPTVPQALRATLSRAMFQCAEGLLAADKDAEARPVFEKLCSPDQPPYIRAAAFPSYVTCLGQKGNELVLTALSGQDKVMQSAALRVLRQSKDETLLCAAIERLENLPPDLQIQMIALMAERRVTAALSAVIKAAKSQEVSVKRTALAALGTLGNASTVSVLANLIATATDEEKKVILSSLSGLQGEGIDDALMESMKQSPPAAQRELIRALVARNSRASVSALLTVAESPNPDVRREALAALGKLADIDACEPLIQLSQKSAPSELPVIGAALSAICRRAGTAAPLIAALPKSSATQKAWLLGVLGTVGDTESLVAVRAALKDSEANVRLAALKALSEWPDAAPLDDLFTLVGSEDVKTNILALRGVARLVPLAKDRPPENLVSLITDALAKATRNEERKALLSALGTVPTLSAMKLAQAKLQDPALAEEAAMAVVQIAEALSNTHRAEAKAAVKQITAMKIGPAIAERAAALQLKFDTPPNLALGAIATSPDDLESDGAASGDQAAIDGNPNTYWDEKDGQKLYILRVQIKQPVTISAIRIMGYRHHDYAPKDFEIFCDDKMVKKVENAQYHDNLLTVFLPPTQCSVLELRITGYYGRSPAIRELEIFGENPPATPQKK